MLRLFLLLKLFNYNFLMERTLLFLFLDRISQLHLHFEPTNLVPAQQLDILRL